MSNGIVTVKLMGGPLDGSLRECLMSDFKRSKTLIIKAQGNVFKYTISRKYDDKLWDAVYNAPRENIIGREDGIGGFGGSRLDY